MYHKILLTSLLLLICTFQSYSQSDSPYLKNIEVSGYLETYYVFDFANPASHDRPDFFYSYDRHNEFNLNIGYVKLAYDSNRVKANIALMTGTYARSNLSHEPGVFRIINEANVSFQPFKKKNTWITAGIFPSHIGFESAVGADCWNLTRSILAENSPYYLSGLRFNSTTKNEKWMFGLTLTNGWQRIQRQAGNQLPGIGHQITYTPNEKLTFNSSSYIGSEFPDSSRRMRYFHDFYAIAEVTKKLRFIVGFDIGFEQQAKGSSKYNTWYSPIMIVKYDITPKFNIAARIEHYSDQNEVIIATQTGNGFSTLGYSLNLDYHFNDRLLFRLEGRSLANDRNIYTTSNGLSKNNTFVSTSLSFRL